MYQQKNSGTLPKLENYPWIKKCILNPELKSIPFIHLKTQQ